MKFKILIQLKTNSLSIINSPLSINIAFAGANKSLHNGSGSDATKAKQFALA